MTYMFETINILIKNVTHNLENYPGTIEYLNDHSLSSHAM